MNGLAVSVRLPSWTGGELKVHLHKQALRTFLLCGVMVLAAGGLAQPVAAQPAPLQGIVWTPPDDPTLATAELRALHTLGVEAIRTPLIQRDHLLTLADTLGLQVFQELQLDHLPAAALADTLAYARSQIAQALDRARRHRSARHFGLARHSDTSDARACTFFQALAAAVRSLPEGRAYYVSAFIEADRCAEAVDFVLLDALAAPDPARLLRRWRAAHPARPAAIGALGLWVDSQAPSGLRVPHSPEAQARYLEKHLAVLLADTLAPPYAVFVYRRADARLPRPSPAHDLTQPYQHNYGLVAADGTPRPANDVVRGFYTGSQTVFAFPPGTAPTPPLPWTLLFGWLVFVLLAACYAFSPRFRYMVPRYFIAHSFYREAIREGRELLLGSSVVLLIALALSAGVLGSIFLEVVRREAAFGLLFDALPEPVQIIGVALLAQPWLLVLLLGSFYALAVALWTSLLSFASRRRQPLIPGQALMLVLWARWPSPLLMAGAMVVPTLPDEQALPLILILAAGWIVLTVSALVRTLRDYAAITYSPPALVLTMGLANPLLVLLLLGLVAALATPDASPVLSFFWHLATRS